MAQFGYYSYANVKCNQWFFMFQTVENDSPEVTLYAGFSAKFLGAFTGFLLYTFLNDFQRFLYSMNGIREIISEVL